MSHIFRRLMQSQFLLKDGHCRIGSKITDFAVISVSSTKRNSSHTCFLALKTNNETTWRLDEDQSAGNNGNNRQLSGPGVGPNSGSADIFTRAGETRKAAHERGDWPASWKVIQPRTRATSTPSSFQHWVESIPHTRTLLYHTCPQTMFHYLITNPIRDKSGLLRGCQSGVSTPEKL